MNSSASLGQQKPVTQMAEEVKQDANQLLQDGMKYFKSATNKEDLKKSLDCFDALIKLNIENKKKLWQRGLTLFYLDEFVEGASQFRLDVALNPNDTEEAIWCYLCEIHFDGKDKALKNWLNVGVDSRAVMRIVYDLFKETDDKKKIDFINKLLGIIKDGKSEKNIFYSNLYLGLYYESIYFINKSNKENDKESYEKAKKFMISATESKYRDYMYQLSVVHTKIRGWS